MHRRRRLFGLCLIALAMIGVPATAQGATPTDTKALEDAVEVGDGSSGIREHLRQFQVIADTEGNNGTRATGTQGHLDSFDYVKSVLDQDDDYWHTTSQSFTADIFTELADPHLAATPAANPAWVANQDFATMEFSGDGTANGASIAIIDFVAPTTKASTSNAGCEDADFAAGATSLAGKIAVIQRGTCDFGLKAARARKRPSWVDRSVSPVTDARAVTRAESQTSKNSSSSFGWRWSRSRCQTTTASTVPSAMSASIRRYSGRTLPE